jgi:uncharacterized integral membrane protein
MWGHDLSCPLFESVEEGSMSTQMDDQAPSPQAPVQVEERSLADNLRLGGGAVLLLALAIFLLQNLDDAEINFLWFDWKLPLVFALVLSAAVGSLATWLFTTIRGRSERRRQEAMFDSAMRGARRDR